EEAALAAWRQEAAAAPLMGEALGPDLVCVGFPEPTTAVSGEASEVGVPVVVLASTGDPATPYAGARDLAADLPTGVLVTRDGDGHGAFRRGAACVDAAAIGALTAVDAGFAVEPQRC
ncbi:MAG: alpha/beta hydrolase, partial [Propioniciclava sp.]